MANERLLDFPAKTTPVGTDILYVGDSAAGYDEVQSTISEVIGGYSAALASIAGLSTSANQMIYTTGSNAYATSAISAFGRSLVASADAPAARTLLGINKHAACAAASTTALTVTYANGTSGVGATLTNAGAQAAFAVDGYNAAVNDRILIKNQASALQNGIYVVTTLGSGASNWVLTRATDYDQASEMAAGDMVAVVGGSTQSATEWMMTQTAAITVGTTDITWAEMGQVTGSVTAVNVQVLSSSTTFTPTSGALYYLVRMQAPGGGSGGSQGGGAGNGAASAGGAAGGYCEKFYTAAQMGASAAYVQGALGTGGSAGNNAGSAGGNSSFTPAGSGSAITANGGGGGGGGATTAGIGITGNATGGTASGGDINMQGGSGGVGYTLTSASLTVGGNGGASQMSPGIAGRISNGNAAGNNSPIGYGGGGGGVTSSSTDQAGVAGDPGVCVIIEFISTSA